MVGSVSENLLFVPFFFFFHLAKDSWLSTLELKTLLTAWSPFYHLFKSKIQELHSLLTDFNSASSINLDSNNKSHFISDTFNSDQAQTGSKINFCTQLQSDSKSSNLRLSNQFQSISKSKLKVVSFPEQLIRGRSRSWSWRSLHQPSK